MAPGKLGDSPDVNQSEAQFERPHVDLVREVAKVLGPTALKGDMTYTTRDERTGELIKVVDSRLLHRGYRNRLEWQISQSPAMQAKWREIQGENPGATDPSPWEGVFNQVALRDRYGDERAA